jgi:RNA polymerase sigma factor (sigma-70 family)
MLLLEEMHESIFKTAHSALKRISLSTTLKRRSVIHDIPDHWTREQKIEQLLTIASTLANSYSRNIDHGLATIEEQDIYQIASMAIVKAVDDYNPDRGAKLTTWALNQARLAIKDALRQTAHASRTMQEKGKYVRWISFNQIKHGNSEYPITYEELISETVHGKDRDVVDSLYIDWQRAQLRLYISKLSEREQQVLLGYLAERPVPEIAEEMGVCDSRVYQIAESAISKMKKFDTLEQARAKINCHREEQKTFTLK